MTTQLFIYNEALGHLGERQLASLSEPREPRRVLDSYWSDVVGFCLSQGLWKFARRTAQIDSSSSLTPQFGFNCVYYRWFRNYGNNLLISLFIQAGPFLQKRATEWRSGWRG